jgi:hypothetical protein
VNDRPDRHGLGDPRIPWVVLLDLAWSGPPPLADLTTSLAAVAAEAGWSPPHPGTVVAGERDGLLRALATSSAEPLRLGRYADGVVLAARHDALDGLAMLTAARRLLGVVRSSARGLSPGVGSPCRGALLRRGWEVLARPPARVAAARDLPTTGEAFATLVLDGAPRTADLVLAGARAVRTWNHEHGRSARRTSVAVGASRAGGAADDLADDSAFLRLTGVEAMDLEQVRSALASAVVQPGGGTDRRGTAGPLAGRALGTALRLAAPRLGSTLLVSHLGALEAEDRLHGAAFYPVTGGGSGLSLGAATLRGRTTLTLRGRGARYDDDALQQLLERVVENLR